jgi:hypothetical protein
MRIVGTFDQQNVTSLLGQHAGGHFRLAKEDKAAPGAGAACAAEDEAIFQRMSAARTVVHFERCGHRPILPHNARPDGPCWPIGSGG